MIDLKKIKLKKLINELCITPGTCIMKINRYILISC